jgi:methylmalonyl-CoA mutase N-terminal domain/subunit
VVVGVNRFTDDSPPPDIPAPDFSRLEAEQIASLADLRRRRDASSADAALGSLAEAARAMMAGDSRRSIVYEIVEAVRARATVGEISNTLEGEWGRHRPS